MKSITLKVDGMRCEGCAATLQTLLGTEVGVQGVTVSHERGEARILFDPNKTTTEQLIAVAERPGFDVSEHSGA